VEPVGSTEQSRPSGTSWHRSGGQWAEEGGLSTLDGLTKDDHPGRVWYFRVVELSGGRWACRHGKAVLDTHTDMQHAIDHITAVATEQRPATLFLHRLDGTIRILGLV
jgi:hypothetical protein